MTDILTKRIRKRYNYNPKIWGPYAWFYHDTIILSYPDDPTNEDKEIYRNHFSNIYKTLPCQKCEINYQTHLKELPLTDEILSDRTKLIRWWISIHNSVRKMTHSKELTEEEFITYYINQYSPKTDDTNITRFIVIICIIAIIFYMTKDFILNRRKI